MQNNGQSADGCTNPGEKSMQIFIDSANQWEIRRWLDQGVVDGVTTNPSIILKDGVHDLEQGARELSALLGVLPLSVEVTKNDVKGLLRQGRQLAAVSPNIVVK